MDGISGGDEMVDVGEDDVRIVVSSNMFTTYVPVDCC